MQAETGVTTLHVTHDQGEALALGHRVAVMRDGRVEQVGTPDEVWERPASTWVARFVGTPPMNLLPDGDGIMGFRAEDAVCRVDADGDVRLRARRAHGRRAALAPARGRRADRRCARPTASRAGAGRARRGRRSRRSGCAASTPPVGGRMSERRQLALMLAPYTLGALLLFIAPAAYSLALALTDADLLTPSRFIGLDNFRELAADEIFAGVLWRSALFVLIAVPLRLAIATGLALVLHARARGARRRAGRRRSCRASCRTPPGRWSGCSCSTRSTGR